MYINLKSNIHKLKIQACDKQIQHTLIVKSTKMSEYCSCMYINKQYKQVLHVHDKEANFNISQHKKHTYSLQ